MKNIYIRDLVGTAFTRLPSPVKKRVNELLPRRIKNGMRKAVNHRGINNANQPLVSVVVPVYNVADLLAECLASIVDQTYRNLEIIVIDDGSTDESLAIARAVAKSDRRIKVHTQSNAGLGAARNAGVRLARGEYLVFADSDDFIPSEAYETMVLTLLESGSDLVTGSFYRFNSTTYEVPRWCKNVHDERRLGISIDDYLDGLVNVYAWNKMFSKTFWDSLQMQYTEGVRYEDQEPTTRMFLQASSIDVIPELVYGYRLREDESSITQTKHLIRDVQDRLHVLKLTAKTVEDSGNLNVKLAWVAKLVRFDVLPYIREAIDADEAYRAVVAELCRFVVNLTNSYTVDHSPVKIRSLMALTLNGDWDEVSRAVLFSDETGPHLPTKLTDGGIEYVPPFAEQITSELSSFALRLSQDETKAVAAVKNAYIDAEGMIRIDGWAFIKNLDTGSGMDSSIEVVAVNQALDLAIPMETSRTVSPDATRWASSKWTSYENWGFSASLQAADLMANLAGADSSEVLLEWTFRVDAKVGEISKSTMLNRRVGGSAANYLDRGRQYLESDWQWAFNASSGLSLIVNNSMTQVAAKLTEETIEFVISGKNVGLAKSLQLVHERDNLVGSVERVNDGTKFTFDRSILQSDDSLSWALRLRGLGKGRNLLTLPGGSSRTLLSPDIALRRDESGTIYLDVLPQLLSIDDLKITSGSCTIEGSMLIADAMTKGVSLQLVSSGSVSRSAPLVWNEGTFTAEIPLDGLTNEPLPFDGYSIRITDESGIERPVIFSEDFARTLPAEVLGKSHRLRLTSTKFGNAWLRLSAPLQDNEVGLFNQKRMQNEYSSYSGPISNGTVLFHAYLGAQAADSSLAISQYLLKFRKDLRIIWAVVSESVEVPAGAERVIFNSAEWYNWMASAEYLVHNIYFDPWFVLKPGQKFLQTWHGTPLKTINRSYWRGIGRSKAWIQRMDRQAASWTHLVSPSPYYSEIVSKESGFEGEVLEVGYPRNDGLSPSPESAQHRKAVRKLLGLEATDTVVLYAPTWREGLSSKSWQADMVQFLDAGAFVNDLGDGYKLLIRGHGHNARTAASREEGVNVLDVTHYSSINDLYLAADVIVTDYSSVMFDAAVANKPMVFFVPDLKEYNSSPRGVYLDVAEIAPGPLVFEQHELVEIIRNLDADQLTGSKIYQEFKQKFSPLDDGNATKRTVEAVWK